MAIVLLNNKITKMRFLSNYKGAFSESLIRRNIATQLLKLTKLKALYLLTAVSVIASSSCKKFVEVEPPKTDLVTSTVFNDANTATAAMLSIYAQMIDNSIPYLLPFHSGLYGDELHNYSTDMFGAISYYTNNLNGVNSAPPYWEKGYSFIYQANAIIEGCQNSNVLDEKIKKQLSSEARFIRAYWYFYLVNLYGDVPLITVTDYNENSKMQRMSKNTVYDFIITDLEHAESDINANYVDATDTSITFERVRPNKSAVRAMLARVHLFKGNFSSAEKYATDVIEDTEQYSLVGLGEVFLKNSREAIWQIPPSTNGTWYNTQEGLNFILTDRPYNCALSNQLINAFELGDNRRSTWVGSLTIDTETFLFPYKYKVKESSDITEYSMILRLAEQFLIRAEAKANLGKINEAKADINAIRNRAGLPNTNADTKDGLLNALLHERQVELFTEWGHRWLDLNRSGKATEVMQKIAPSKGSSWNPNKGLWPIPQLDINSNPNLNQNPGYN